MGDIVCELKVEERVRKWVEMGLYVRRKREWGEKKRKVNRGRKEKCEWGKRLGESFGVRVWDAKRVSLLRERECARVSMRDYVGVRYMSVEE